MVLSGDEAEKLIEASANTYDGALIVFLLDTGARLGEASALRWVDVDLEAGSARIARS
jgi:integrase